MPTNPLRESCYRHTPVVLQRGCVTSGDADVTKFVAGTHVIQAHTESPRLTTVTHPRRRTHHARQSIKALPARGLRDKGFRQHAMFY